MKSESLEERKKEFQKILKAYPGKIPVIVDKHPHFPNLNNISKQKLLLSDMTIDSFLFYIAKHLDIDLKTNDSELEINLYHSLDNPLILSKKESVFTLYDKYKEEDGFLYLKYSYKYVKFSNKKKLNNISNNNINSEFQSKLPIILEKDPNFPYIKGIQKNKFLIIKNFSVTYFSNIIITKYLELKNLIDSSYLNFILKTQSKYIELQPNEIFENIFSKYKSEDGYLYLYYSYDYTFKKLKKKISLQERKTQYETLKKRFPGKIPLIIEKNPNCPGIKNLVKKKQLVNELFTVSDMISRFVKTLDLKDIIGDTKLNFTIIETKNYLPLAPSQKISEIYDIYKEEEGFLYLQYFYEYVKINNLKVFEPKYKKEKSFNERKKDANKIYYSMKKFPIIIERYPSLKIKEEKDIAQKYFLNKSLKLYQVKDMIEKIYNLQEKIKVKLTLITEKNIDLRNQENFFIEAIYKKYKDEDGWLYFYYIESSLLPNPGLNNNELFKFKRLFTLEERKLKYQELKSKNHKNIILRIEKEFDLYNNNNIDNDNNNIIYSDNKENLEEFFSFSPDTEIDTLKMKIWKKIGMPFLSVELFDENKKIIENNNYSKIIDLYNNYKDKEDNFLYIFYQCYKPKIGDKEYENTQNMTEARKILFLFKRIPFIFSPSPNFGNSDTKTKVYLPYISKLSKFKEIQTDKKYKYYLEYPNKILDINEPMYDFYWKNKNKTDDFLYLIIDKE